MKEMIIIFGATGDLTKRKLMPALFKLYERRVIGTGTPIVCVARRKLSKEAFIKHLDFGKFLDGADQKILRNFIRFIHYVPIDFENPNKAAFADRIAALSHKYQAKNKVFYLAVSPGLFEPAIDIIKQREIIGEGYKRIVFEKPFGNDLKSAQKLNRCVSATFTEDEIYRIDHYLGKELVQNILVFRFANSIFEQIWNKEHVDSVQITVSEELGVETRGSYYDQAGAIRDMVQNHLLQVLSLAAMEMPFSMSADHIRDMKARVIKSLVKPTASDVVVGQYTSGRVGGKRVCGYKSEKRVNRRSTTETYAAIKVNIDVPRWQGVPFYIRTGKRLESRYAEINVVMKDVSCGIFCNSSNAGKLHNVITIRIQPEEGITIRFNAKTPGFGMDIEPVLMEFCHHCEFGYDTKEAYEILLHEVIKGDQALFTRWDNVEASWKYVDSVINLAKRKKLEKYKAGSAGPAGAAAILARDEREWVNEVK